jgi:hypothetical protein
MAKTINEHQTKTVSRTLSGGAGLCPVGSGIVLLKVSVNSKLKVGPCLGQVEHCPVGLDIVR